MTDAPGMHRRFGPGGAHRGAVPRLMRSLLLVVVMEGCYAPALFPPVGVRTRDIEESQASFQSGGEDIRVDTYRPKSGGRHPVAIILHGSGGIHAIAPSTTSRYARTLAQLGIEALVVHYFDGTGQFRADDQDEREFYFHWVREVRDAITWARQLAGVQLNRISLVGQSLGSWVAVGAAVNDPRIYRMALFGAGLEPFLEDSVSRIPPTVLFHGDSDDVVPLSDAKHLADVLKANGRRVQLVVYPGETHALNDSAATDALLRTARFIAPRRQLVPRR